MVLVGWDRPLGGGVISSEAGGRFPQICLSTALERGADPRPGLKKHGLFLELIYVRRVFYGVTPSRADLTPADARPASYRRIRQDPAMGSTVIGKKPAKVVARLGRRGRRGDDADDGQGGVRHTPLNAAWAILQAYAIIAIATSSYGSIFASPPPPPEQSAVRPPKPRARPARSTRALEPEPPFAPRRRPDEFAAVFFSPCKTDAPRSTRGAHRVPRPPPRSATNRCST